MTNVEALKNLYVALGGSAEDVANLDSNAAIINILGNVAGGGGASAGGLVVNSSVSNGTATLDKTFAEIESAMKAGRTVVIKTEAGGVVSVYTVTYTSSNQGTGYYDVTVHTGEAAMRFTADSPDGYPSLTL